MMRGRSSWRASRVHYGPKTRGAQTQRFSVNPAAPERQRETALEQALERGDGWSDAWKKTIVTARNQL
jgi:hypothetical protein